MIEKFGIFVIPTMPAIDKIMRDNKSRRLWRQYGDVPFRQYLGNWYTETQQATFSAEACRKRSRLEKNATKTEHVKKSKISEFLLKLASNFV